MRRATWIERSQGLVICVVLAMVWGGTSAATGDDTALPKAEAVIARHIEATGGKAAYAKTRTVIVEGTIEHVMMGMKGKMISYSSDPNKAFVRVEFEGMGTIEEGSDGNIAWERSMMGPRILEGEELAVKMRLYTFNSLLKWKELYKSAECVAVEEVNEKPCYKLVITPKTGNPETWYIDKESYLLIKLLTVIKHAMGEIPVEATFHDHREVDGVLSPFRTVQKLMMQELHVNVASIKYNADIPAEQFELPADIKQLVEKAKEPQPQPSTQPAGHNQDAPGS